MWVLKREAGAPSPPDLWQQFPPGSARSAILQLFTKREVTRSMLRASQAAKRKSFVQGAPNLRINTGAER